MIMPYCPSCKYEYKIGIAVCPDCGKKLVDRLPDEDQPNGNETPYKDWIPIARLTSQQLAEMVLEGLRAKDIPAVIDSRAGHFGQTGQFGVSSYRPVGGAYTLMVPKDFIVDADSEAQLILGEEWEKVRIIDINDR